VIVDEKLQQFSHYTLVVSLKFAIYVTFLWYDATATVAAPFSVEDNMEIGLLITTGDWV
jgi:hypothetical protein